MKKLISYLIAAMMVFTMMPGIAFAESNPQASESNAAGQETATESINLYIEQFNPLYSDGEKIVEVIDGISLFSESVETASEKAEYVKTIDEAAAVLRAGMVERQEEVVINMQITADDFNQEALNAKYSAIVDAAFEHTGNSKEGDSLKWVYESLPAGLNASGDGTNFYAIFTFAPVYYTTAEQEAELTAAVEALKSELNLDGKSDYEKVKAIYDYMTANITYDYDHYGNDSYKLQFTAYAALVNKTSVCQGYATLLYRMALEYGIDIRLIAGTSTNNQGKSEGHSWNIVKLGSKYYNLDATWDSTWDNDKTTHNFFLQSPATFKNHTRDAEFETSEFHANYPMSNTDYVPGTDDDQDGSEGNKPEPPVEPDEPEVCTHVLVKHVAKDPTCTVEGNIEYYTCSKCEKIFADAEGKMEITKPDTIIGAVAHIFTEVTTEPTCTEEGKAELVCIDCGKSILKNTVPALGHKLTKHVAKDPTCTTDGSIEYYTCDVCGKLYADAEGEKEITKPDTIIGAEAHIFQEVTVAPTCTEPGQTKLVCIGCGKTIVISTTLPKGHIPDGNPIIEPTCEKDGLMVTVKCAVCGETITEQEVIPALGHTSKKTVTKATTKKAGSVVETCKTCGKQLSKKTISRIKTPVFKNVKFVYDTKVKKPTITVKNYAGSKLKAGTDYSIKFKNQQNKVVTAPKTVGKYTAIVTFKGNYSGTVSKEFTINPKATAINKLTKPGKKQIKVTWQKRTAQVTGYEIQYSTTKNFTKKTTKTLKVKNYKTNTKTIKNLKAKKKYWVKIRTYKTVGKKTYYSAWSKVKTITTK